MNKRLQEIRKEDCNFSQEEMANELDISFPAYRNYEKGDRELKVSTIQKILNLQLKNGLKINAQWLLTGHGSKYIIENTLLRKKPDNELEQNNKLFGKLLQAIQANNDLLNDEIAEIMGISEEDYRDISLNRKEIKGSQLIKILSNFSINPTEIFYPNNSKFPQQGYSGGNLIFTQDEILKIKKLIQN